MNILVWILQSLLALVFLAHGLMMVFPPEAVAVQMNAALPRWFQLFIGTTEVLAAVGLTLPAITRVQPWLISASAVGLMIVMISATVFHLQRGEISSAIVTVVLLAMSTYVAYMRWRVMPIRPRTVV